MTLFERTGGEPAPRLAVGRFYVRVLADPLLASFFGKADPVRLKSRRFAFLSQTTGGPQKCSGATMAQAHARLRIEERHFNARSLGVGEDIIGEVVAALTPLAAGIVNASAAGA